MIYTAMILDQLINCPKTISMPTKKEMRIEGMHRRNEMDLKSVDTKHSFHAFMRQHDKFTEDFSVGLIYLPTDERRRINILRCNGAHGGHKVHPHHLQYHIHRCNAADVNDGNDQPRHILPTSEYAAFPDALRYFLRRINVQEEDRLRYFFDQVVGDLYSGESLP